MLFRSPLFGVNYPMLGLPEWVATVALWGASGLGVFLLFLVLPSVRRAPHQIPWIVALPVAAQVLWTLIGDSNFSFQPLIPLFHGLQYLLVAWAVEMQEEPKKPANEKYFLFKRSALWTSANLMGGALLFYGLPRIFSSFGLELGFCTAVFFVTVQVHHFLVDGVIWKIRREPAGSPLFQHFAEKHHGEVV